MKTFPRLFFAIVFFLTLFPAMTQTPIEIPLLPEGAKEGIDQSAIFVHLPPLEKRNGTAVIICPGGGYGIVSIGNEGHDVAQWFNQYGVAAIVLKYRLPGKPGNGTASPLEDAHAAIRLVRQHAHEWGIDPRRVGFIGFSAGGHVASTAGTHYDRETRPDFLLLIYPVITMGEFAHHGSKLNLLGPNPTADLVKLYSNELQVTKDTPPTFLAHADDDRVVDPRNSVNFYLALKASGVPAELHLYQLGGHGLKGGGGYGIGGTGLTVSTTWPQRALDWLTERGLLGLVPQKYESK